MGRNNDAGIAAVVGKVEFAAGLGGITLAFTLAPQA